jgi:uncharacterized protein YsxB (DUF464 family)
LVRVFFTLDPEGCLTHIQVSGHAGCGKSGHDIVCAAVTALVRTALHLLSGQEALGTVVYAGKEGVLEGTVAACPPHLRAWARGVTEFLLTGIGDLKTEYPDYIEIKPEGDHGT